MNSVLQQNREIYNIEHWSQNYFDINLEGDLIAYPQGKEKPSIKFSNIKNLISNEKITPPYLVRFTDILRHRLQQLQSAFTEQISKHEYQGHYIAVYPIKVNQQRHVVEALLKNSNNFGLEAGSKPELMAVMALANKPNFTIICNGYKDREYIRLALIGKQLGFNVYIIIEKYSELDLVIEESQKLNIIPLIGLRVRLASIAAGNWQNTGGEKSKFGLTSNQVITAIKKLKTANLISSLKLLHTHMGSQISNIRDIQKGLQECACFYAELRSLNINIEYVDIGGGLGIDYEGSRSRNYCSINYTLAEYVQAVINAFKEISLKKNIPCPNIITEAGRAMTAHHAVLFLPIIAIEKTNERPIAPNHTAPEILKKLWSCHENLAQNSIIELYHDICHYYNEAQSLFNLGLLTLEQRAHAESIYTATCLGILKLLKPNRKVHQMMIDDLNENFADKVFCNFSLFQSLPDIWAIDQIFPILPISNLGLPLKNRCIIQDITCDSDGRIDNYVDGESLEKTLPLPDLKPGDFLAVFLVGAYQEILGDMHNLFGDTHVVNIECNIEGNYQIESIEKGDNIDELLSYVHFDANNLLKQYKTHLTNSNLPEQTQRKYLQFLQEGISGYSYLEDY